MRITRRLLALTLLSCLLSSAEGTGSVATATDIDVLWVELLQASLDMTPEAKALIERTAKDPPCASVGRLSEILLEEWELKPTADSMRQPRIVYAPRPDYSDLFDTTLGGFKSPIVVATGEVTPLGTVEGVELLIRTGVETIDERCLEAFKKWRYRPARKGTDFVRSKVGITCHIHLK